MTDATQIVLCKRPAGDVTADCFRQESVELCRRRATARC